MAAVAALVAGAVALVWALAGKDEHHLTLEVANAPGVVPGLAVRAAGQRIGTIESAEVTPQRRARLRLSIDDAAWPLPADSRLQLRVGGAIKYTDRYLDVRRGRARKVWAEDGRVPASAFVAPTDIDQVLFTFDGDTRDGLRALLRNGGAAFGAAKGDLRAALDRSPPAIAQAREVVDDLGGDPGTLAALVRSSDRVTRAIQSSRPDLDALLASASATFDEVGRDADQVRDVIGAAPATLEQARGTLARANGTLRAAQDLTTRLAPGVQQVRRAAGPLRRTLRRLVQVGPDARSTLTTLGDAAPDLNRLLDTARPLMPRLQAIGTQGAVAVSCIRPYAPELAGLITTWGTGIWANADGKDHYVRAEVGTYTFPNASPLNSAQLTSSQPGIKVSFPRPPGQIAGQPWYQPQCDIGPETGDAANDPENGAKATVPADFFADHPNPDPEANK